MNRQIIIKGAAIAAVVFILFLFGLTFYFGVTGNTDAFFLVISSNAFFVILLYLLMRSHRSNQIRSALLKMEEDAEQGTSSENTDGRGPTRDGNADRP